MNEKIITIFVVIVAGAILLAVRRSKKDNSCYMWFMDCRDCEKQKKCTNIRKEVPYDQT